MIHLTDASLKEGVEVDAYPSVGNNGQFTFPFVPLSEELVQTTLSDPHIGSLGSKHHINIRVLIRGFLNVALVSFMNEYVFDIIPGIITRIRSLTMNQM